VIPGHRARWSVEDVMVVGCLPLRLTVTVLDAADAAGVLHRALTTVEGRPDVGRCRRGREERRYGAVGRGATTTVATVDTDGRAGDDKQKTDPGQRTQHVPLNCNHTLTIH